MLVNGVDISTYGARLLGIKNNSTNITNNYFIPPNGNMPVFVSETNNGKQISVRIAINGNSVDANYQVYSRLKRDMNICTLKPNNSSFYFDCILIGDNVNTQFRKVIKEVEFSFICTQYSAQTSTSPTALNTLYDINNQGTATTPAIIRFKPTGSAFSGKSIIFNFFPYYLNSNVFDQQCYSIDLTSEDIGKEIVINSEDVTFRIGGNNEISRLNISGYRTRVSGYNPITGLPNLYSLDELPVMEFPHLQSGITKFKIVTSESITTNNGFTCSITWKPRWL